MTTQPPPARIGDPASDIDTPALVVDLDAFERNLDRMAAAVTASGLKLRAHSKTHKCPTVALAQIARGAVGVCCQKVGEAEAMVRGGVRDVLVTNQIVGRRKVQRLAALAREVRIGACVDDPVHVDALSQAAREAGASIDVLVEIDVGAGRCGIATGAPALELAKQVDAAEGLRFRGLQAYQGAAQHIRDFAERQAAIETAVGLARETRDLLAKNGLPCEDVTGAGTGSFRFEAASGVYTELQCGSYALMDADYAKNLDETGAMTPEFEHALHVHVTVISKTRPGRCVVDAGHKALGNDQGMPWVAGLDDAEYGKPSDEHGTVTLGGADNRIHVGDRLRLVPGHVDPTVNLYDWFVGVRGGRVESLWPITARGALT